MYRTINRDIFSMAMYSAGMWFVAYFEFCQKKKRERDSQEQKTDDDDDDKEEEEDVKFSALVISDSQIFLESLLHAQRSMLHQLRMIFTLNVCICLHFYLLFWIKELRESVWFLKRMQYDIHVVNSLCKTYWFHLLELRAKSKNTKRHIGVRRFA